MKCKRLFLCIILILIFCLTGCSFDTSLTFEKEQSDLNELRYASDSMELISIESVIGELDCESDSFISENQELLMSDNLFESLAIQSGSQLPEWNTQYQYPLTEFESIKEGTSFKDLVEKFGLPVYIPLSGSCYGYYYTIEGKRVTVGFDIKFDTTEMKDLTVVSWVTLPSD